jgi:hypothetical protein
MRTLADLVERFQLYAVCSDCERMERLSLEPLMERLGGALEISEVRKRLRCRGCGVRTGDIRIVYVGENQKVSGFHYGGRRPEIPPQPLSSSVDSSVRPNPSTPT